MKKLLAITTAIIAIQTSTAHSATGQFIGNYTVQVTLSPKAAAKLKKSGETIDVTAEYFGVPIAGDTSPINDDGNVYLADEKKTFSKDGSVKLGHVKLPSKLLNHVVDGQPSVLLNLFTSRKKFADNLLDCDIFQDKVSLAQTKPVVIACKLIGE